MQIDWVELHRLNRVWRGWMDVHSNFVTPDTLDSLRYCRIEANEGADLELRAKLPQHARNNERQHTIPGELAQVVMLCLTALDEIVINKLMPVYQIDPDLPLTLDTICTLADRAVMEYIQDFAYWIDLTHILLVTITELAVVNVESDLRQCWWQLAWKHANYHMHGYPEELKP